MYSVFNCADAIFVEDSLAFFSFSLGILYFVKPPCVRPFDKPRVCVSVCEESLLGTQTYKKSCCVDDAKPKASFDPAVEGPKADKSAMFRYILLISLLSQAVCFAPTGPVTRISGLTQLRCSQRSGRQPSHALNLGMQEGAEGHSVYRRDVLKLFTGGAAAILSASSTEAAVFIDTERYGDKELKVALINQVKQQFRALYEKKPELIVPLFRLAVTDALSVRSSFRSSPVLKLLFSAQETFLFTCGS